MSIMIMEADGYSLILKKVSGYPRIQFACKKHKEIDLPKKDIQRRPRNLSEFKTLSGKINGSTIVVMIRGYHTSIDGHTKMSDLVFTFSVTLEKAIKKRLLHG